VAPARAAFKIPKLGQAAAPVMSAVQRGEAVVKQAEDAVRYGQANIARHVINTYYEP
jgi:hypothetical protein